MKILFVASRYHTNQHFWMKALQAQGNSIKFICTFKTASSEYYKALTPVKAESFLLPIWLCNLFDLFMKLQGKLPRTQFHIWPKYTKLKEEIQEFGPDIVIVRDLVFPLSLATFWATKKLGIKTVLYNQHPIEASEPLTTRILQRLGVAPRLRITPARTTNMHINPKTNARYVPLITDFDFNIESKEYLPNGKLRILTVAKLSLERKKIRLLIEALTELKDTLNFHLTIIGALKLEDTEEYNKLQVLIKERALQSYVTVLENISYEEMPKHYQSSDVFILPSINEPYSISPLEAMNFGLPVILTDTNGARNCVEPGVTGYTVKSNSVTSLKSAILQLKDKKTLTDLGREAFNQRQEQFGPQAFLKYFNMAISNKN